MDHIHRVTEVKETTPDGIVSPSVFLARIVYFIFGVIIAFIILRIVLLLLGANQGNGVVDIVYGVSSLFVAPFYGFFNNVPSFGASVLDVSSIVAVVVYALISWGIVALLTLGMRDRSEV